MQFIHTHLIFSQPDVDYEQDDANKGDGSNEDKFYKQIVWTSFESLKRIIVNLSSMISTFIFKIYPKIYMKIIHRYLCIYLNVPRLPPVTCGHFLRPFPLQGTLYQCSFYWHCHDCLYCHQSQFTILCNNQTPNQILHLYSDRYHQPKPRLKLVLFQNQGK